MIWTEAHDDFLVREILVVEPYRYKQGTVKRGEAWTQVSEILNAVEYPKFRVNQRGVRDRYTTLEKAFKKKMADEEKSSGTIPPELTDLEIGIREIIEKFEDFSLHVADKDLSKQDADKKKAEDMRLKSLETFSETRKRSLDQDDDESPKSSGKRRSSGSETMAFLRMKAEKDSELRQQELKVKSDEVKLQQKLMQEQQKTLAECMGQISKQQQASQQQQQQMMVAQMQFQQQQTQVFAALIEKLSK